jgi:hypothetical protein
VILKPIIWGPILVDLDTLVPSEVTKKCVDTDLVQKTGMNHLAVLYAGARMVRDLVSNGLRPRCRSCSSLRAFGQSVIA